MISEIKIVPDDFIFIFVRNLFDWRKLKMEKNKPSVREDKEKDWEEENIKKVSNTLEEIVKTKEDIKILKEKKEIYLKFIEKYFTSMEEKLINQKEILESNLKILSIKEASNLEEILQISKQIELIHKDLKKPFELKEGDLKLENEIKNIIFISNTKKKVPRKIYDEIDLLRHYKQEKLIKLVDKYILEFDEDLTLKIWKAEAIFQQTKNTDLIKEILETKETNNGFDMYAIGKAYSLLEDEENAMKWWKLSADKGNYLGETNYGHSFLDGSFGVQKNLKTAEIYYKRAIEKEYFRALNFLAHFYDNSSNYSEETFYLYLRAAKQNYGEGAYNVAIIFLDGDVPEEFSELDYEKEAIKWLKIAADYGMEDAKTELAELGQ